MATHITRCVGSCSGLQTPVNINRGNITPQGLYPVVANILSRDLLPPLPMDLEVLLLDTELSRYQLCLQVLV